MFEWLVNEMQTVKTRKFYLVDGPFPDDKRESQLGSEVSLPPSYTSFVNQFGNVKLYRIGSQYRVQVQAVPTADETQQNEVRLCFGRTEDTQAYFKQSLLVPGEESAVFEWNFAAGNERQTASGFAEWLREKCKRARRVHTKKEWREIEQGPSPFSDHEQRIVDGRRKFHWRVIGVSSRGDIQFEVYNGSDIVLPFLSIGIRGKRRETESTLNGGVWLPVDSVLPGHKSVIEKDCYSEWIDPDKVEAFEKPDPEPEDRDRYWEFKPLQKNNTA